MTTAKAMMLVGFTGAIYMLAVTLHAIAISLPLSEEHYWITYHPVVALFLAFIDMGIIGWILWADEL